MPKNQNPDKPSTEQMRNDIANTLGEAVRCCRQAIRLGEYQAAILIANNHLNLLSETNPKTLAEILTNGVVMFQHAILGPEPDKKPTNSQSQ